MRTSRKARFLYVAVGPWGMWSNGLMGNGHMGVGMIMGQ